MIHYELSCEHGHRFDGWFASSKAFEAQCDAGQLVCPTCGTAKVSRALMAPAVRLTRARSAPAQDEAPAAAPAAGEGPTIPAPVPQPGAGGVPGAPAASDAPPAPDAHGGEAPEAALRIAADAMRRAIEAQATNVGRRFAEEARKIHYGETSARAIYGEATEEDVRDLENEGIEVLTLPHRIARSN